MGVLRFHDSSALEHFSIQRPIVDDEVPVSPILDRKTWRMSWVNRRAYGVWMLGVKWAQGWSTIPKARQRRFSRWVRP